MKHFVAYHNVEDFGPYKTESDLISHYSTKIKQMEDSIGHFVWVISGEYISGTNKTFKLCSVFTPKGWGIDDDDFEYVYGTGTEFDPHINLFTKKWFEKLKNKLQNFRFGFSEITEAEIIQGLEEAFRSRETNDGLPFLSEEIPLIEQLFEGAKKKITVNSYERSKKARKECIKHWGYKCSVCERELKEIYGEIANEIIHVHHLLPISEINSEYQINPIEDLRPVCPNCHSVIHSKNPAYTIDEVRKLIKKSPIK